MAHPPTNSAGPVLRAGLTDVLVTGMLIRWMSVRPRPMAKRRETGRGAPIRGAQDDHHEHEGHDDLGDRAGQQGVLARRMLTVAIGCEAILQREPRSTGGNHVEDAGANDSADDLGDEIARQLPGLEAAAHPQAHRHRGIEVGAGDRPDGIGHRQHRETESEGNAQKPDAEYRGMLLPERRCRTHPTPTTVCP